MDLSRMAGVDGSLDSSAIIIDPAEGAVPGDVTRMRSPLSKTRSLSDGGGGTPKLSPSPFIVEGSRRESKDDISIRDKDSNDNTSAGIPSVPSTPIRTGFHMRGLSLQMPRRELASPAALSQHQQQQQQQQQEQQQLQHQHQHQHQHLHPHQQQDEEQHRPSHQSAGYVRQAPLSPKLDHSHIYASPTNILPRRSRGLDFSRAATSLHHSTLADPAEPDSSPTIGSRAMNIPGRRNASEYPGAGADSHHHHHHSSSLWGIMANQERMQISSSVGSTNHVLSDSSSASDEDDYMDEDMDEAYITTPHAPNRIGVPGSGGMGAPGLAPWMAGSPAANSLLSFQQRQRQRKQPKKKMRGPLGLGFHSPAAASGAISKSPPSSLPHSRRESISWAANQLHISGNESDGQVDGIDSPSRPSVVRRAVTRRGNLLPKTKGFARIRAALLEESAPLETEIRSEAEVVRQVRESDMDLEPRLPPPSVSAATTALSSPNLDSQSANPDDMLEDAMMIEPSAGSNNFLSLTQKFKGKSLFSEADRQTTTPPPPGFGLARHSSSGLSMDDMNMDSPSASSSGGGNAGQGQNSNNPFILPQTTTSSSGNGTPQQPLGTSMMPSAADITRRINSKRRRDDDFDPVSIKRRAVSPGMSAHNSPIMQSPLQRDMGPWGGMNHSRPGSVGGDSSSKPGGSGAPSENGSAPGGQQTASGRGGKVRVGYQGMVDTNDGITKLSIE